MVDDSGSLEHGKAVFLNDMVWPARRLDGLVRARDFHLAWTASDEAIDPEAQFWGKIEQPEALLWAGTFR